MAGLGPWDAAPFARSDGATLHGLGTIEERDVGPTRASAPWTGPLLDRAGPSAFGPSASAQSQAGGTSLPPRPTPAHKHAGAPYLPRFQRHAVAESARVAFRPPSAFYGSPSTAPDPNPVARAAPQPVLSSVHPSAWILAILAALVVGFALGRL
ncbi:MAG: hypothetical protein U0414_03930 [Polyangiaceae bacterium]